MEFWIKGLKLLIFAGHVSVSIYVKVYKISNRNLQKMFLNLEHLLPVKKASTNNVDPDQTASEEAV